MKGFSMKKLEYSAALFWGQKCSHVILQGTKVPQANQAWVMIVLLICKQAIKKTCYNLQLLSYL